MATDLPKISCLTVTADRLVLLKEAVRCFRDQTYPNKELVIVTDGRERTRDAIHRYLRALGDPAIRMIALDGERRTLGALRNIAVEAASGDVICQWDDDDLYHPDRLRVQLDFMVRGEGRACLMTDYLQFFREEREMFWVDWTNRTDNPRHHLLPGTLLMFKDPRFRYPEAGADAERGEDDALIDQMYPVIRIVALSGAGHLYVYTYHGRNTFSRDHHVRLAIESASPSERILARRETLEQALAYYRLPMPYVVRSRDERTLVINR